MKRLFTTSLCISISFLMHAQLPTSGLVADYPFNSNANDASGNNNNGEVYGASSTTDRFGKPNSAYLFDGNDDYISVASSNNLQISGPITMSAWFKSSDCNSYAGIICKSEIDEPRTGYLMYIDTDDYPTVSTYYNHQESKMGVAKYLTNCIDNQWHHMLSVYDGQRLKLYIDGNLCHDAEYSLGMQTNNAPLLIGWDMKSYSTDRHFNGAIDDIKIYNRALEQIEIQSLYYNEAVTLNTGMVGHYPFNSNANDESGNGNNGQVMGATLVKDRFENANSAYYFDGTNDYITVSSSPSLQITGAITMSTWFKTSYSNDFAGIITKSEVSEPRTGYLMYIDANDQPSVNLYHNHQTLEMGVAKSNISGVDDNWHHMVSVYDGNILKFYIDGILKSEVEYNLRIQSNNAPLVFGWDMFSNSNDRLFEGYIDDIRIFNRALNNQEVTSLYGNTVTTSGLSTTKNSQTSNLIEIFHNTSQNLLVISFSHLDANVIAEIYNMKGEKIQVQILDSIESSIDISKLTKGCYVIHMHNSSINYSTNFIR